MGFKKFTSSSEQFRPDAKYNSKLASKFINCMMYQGKKTVAQAVFYDSLELITKKIKDIPPIQVFEQAVENVKPNIEIRSKRVGGSNYQVPIPVNPKRSRSLAIRWILEASRGKKGKPMCERLASEFIDAFNRTGAAMNTRENVHRMADANKAFAHFAW